MGLAGWLRAWLNPPVPAHISAALQQAQFDSVRKQVPMLLAVAALNTAIIMSVCAHENLPPSHYMWMTGLIGYCVIRICIWVHRLRKPIDPRDIPRLLRINVAASLIMMTGLGIATTYTFIAGTFQSMLLIPMSLGFGATSIAHCLYTLRPAAIGTILIGLFPSSTAMIIMGPFEAQMLGVAMISVGILMVRFVSEQYRQLITSLLLAAENQQLALTDPLTGLGNRRAMMAALDTELAAGTRFAVALIDLDGFKQVNDSLGHQAGDQLLVEVANRLSGHIAQGDAVGRLGGDEFLILFRNVAGKDDCDARAATMLAALGQPVTYAGKPVKFGASLGFAICGIDASDGEALLQHADRALYAAKRGEAAFADQRAPAIAA